MKRKQNHSFRLFAGYNTFKQVFVIGIRDLISSNNM